MAKLHTKAMITLEVYSFFLINMTDYTSNKGLNSHQLVKMQILASKENQCQNRGHCTHTE
jgi:hypothetical protein